MKIRERKTIAGEAAVWSAWGCSRRRVYRGAFWAINRPPRIVEPHTFTAKPRLGLVSVREEPWHKTYDTGARKKAES